MYSREAENCDRGGGEGRRRSRKGGVAGKGGEEVEGREGVRGRPLRMWRGVWADSREEPERW